MRRLPLLLEAHPLSRIPSISPRKCFGSTCRVSRTGPGAPVSNISPETRQNELRKAGFREYPRAGDTKVTSLSTVRDEYAQRLQPGEVDAVAEDVTGMQLNEPKT